MKRVLLILIVLVLFVPLALASFRGLMLVVNPETAEVRPPPDRVEIYFFFDSAGDDIEFFRIVSEYIDEGNSSALFTVDTSTRSGRRTFRELSYELLHMNYQYLRVPLMIMNGLVYQGFDSIRENFEEAYLTAVYDFFVRGHIFNP